MRRFPRKLLHLVIRWHFSHRYLSFFFIGGTILIIFVFLYAFGHHNSTSFEIQTIKDIPPRSKETARSLLQVKPILTPKLNQTKTFLVILVLTAPGNFDNRKAIRKTWADQTLPLRNSNATFQTVFLIGQSNLTDIIIQEYALYNDILLGSFEDNYHRLVSKVHLGINWALDSIQFEYLIKCDDDVYLNIPRIFKWLQSSNGNLPKDFYGGYIHYNVKPVRKDYKNALSKTEYHGKLFPPYAAGPTYILSSSALTLVVNASHFVQPFKIEDAFMGCLAQYSGIKPTHVDGFRLHFSSNYMATSNICEFIGVYVFGHNLNSSSLTKLHSDIKAIETLDVNPANILCIQGQFVIVLTRSIMLIAAIISVVFIGVMICLFYLIYTKLVVECTH